MATSWPYNATTPPVGTACAGNSSYTDASGTDDATALQALINAAVASGGVPVVVLPARRTYRIGTTLTIPAGITIQGHGGLNGQNVSQPATLVWSGAAGGTLCDVAIAAQNIPCVAFENIMLQGRSDRTNLPATLLKFRGTGGNTGATDSGTILRNVWFGDCSGNALSIEGGSTNLLIDNGRFDNWGGYAIYVTGPSGVPKSANITISGNCTMTNPYACNGGIFLDGEGDGANSLKTVIKLYGLHPEFGGVSLNETYSGGTNPFDKRGWVRLGVNAAVTDVQHHVYVDGMQVDGPFSVASFSMFQLTATTTADSNLDNTRMVNITADTCKGLSRGTTDANANDEIRILGGRVHADYRPPVSGSGNIGHFHLGVGLWSTGGQVWSWTSTHGNYLLAPVLQTRTVSQLATITFVKQGMLEVVTDSNATTRGATVAGGGANVVLVLYDGSNWVIV